MIIVQNKNKDFEAVYSTISKFGKSRNLKKGQLSYIRRLMVGSDPPHSIKYKNNFLSKAIVNAEIY